MSLASGLQKTPAISLRTGVQPIAPNFAKFEVYPQPGDLAWAELSQPTRGGRIEVAFNQSSTQFRLRLGVPAGSTSKVCLPPPAGLAAGDGGVDQAAGLSVDGKAVEGVVEGRMLCAPGELGAGQHSVVRAS